jgi:hypothetical protein
MVYNDRNCTFLDYYRDHAPLLGDAVSGIVFVGDSWQQAYTYGVTRCRPENPPATAIELVAEGGELMTQRGLVPDTHAAIPPVVESYLQDLTRQGFPADFPGRFLGTHCQSFQCAAYFDHLAASWNPKDEHPEPVREALGCLVTSPCRALNATTADGQHTALLLAAVAVAVAAVAAPVLAGMYRPRARRRAKF